MGYEMEYMNIKQVEIKNAIMEIDTKYAIKIMELRMEIRGLNVEMERLRLMVQSPDLAKNILKTGG